MIQANDCYMESLEWNISEVNSINYLSHMTTYTIGSTKWLPLTTFQAKKKKKSETGSSYKSPTNSYYLSQVSLTIWPSMAICVTNAPTLGTSLGDESPTNPHPTWDRWGVTLIGALLPSAILAQSSQDHFNTYNALRFVDQDLSFTKSSVRQLLDDASKVCVAASQRIFMVRDCREWLCPPSTCVIIVV